MTVCLMIKPVQREPQQLISQSNSQTKTPTAGHDNLRDNIDISTVTVHYTHYVINCIHCYVVKTGKAFV